MKEPRVHLLSRRTVPVIVGPTAVGKTELALELAEALEAEIVSADSRQVYRYMNIGTAKPTPKEMQRVPHHMIDVRNPDQHYSAGEYGREAREIIERMLKGGCLPLVVGGSGFYLQALFDGLFEPRISDPETRQLIRERVRKLGLGQVYQQLRKIDPESADRIHANDEQRIVRALEVYQITGRPMSEFFSQTPEPASFRSLWIGLERVRDDLYQRINERVDRMFESGLVDEVRGLLARGYSPELNALRTVGYREVIAHLRGEIALGTAVELVKRNSRRYAKRQFTWFRHESRVQWIRAGEESFAQVFKMLRQGADLS